MGFVIENVRQVPMWAGNGELASAYTTRAFGSLSARSESPETIEQRFQALASTLDVERTHLFGLYQTHSNNVAVLRDRSLLDRPAGQRSHRFSADEVYTGSICIDASDFDMSWQKGIDGVILAVDDIFAVVSTADCAPVMFWEPTSRVCGIAHVGLVGAINQLPMRMVTLMQQELGISSGNLEVAILPSIRRCHYNLAKSGVWQRLHHAISEAHGADNPHYADGHFDLPGFIRWQLESTGVHPSCIADLGICTVCQAHDFFSHVHAGSTGTQEKEGRFGSVIGVRSSGPVK